MTGRGQEERETHEVNLAAWDHPSPVIVGGIFTIKVGAKCSAGCALAGERIDIRDATGARVAVASVGESPWEGTTGLRWTLVELRAPSEPGVQSWSLALDAAGRRPHHARAVAAFSFVTVPPPEHIVSLRVVEKGSERPLEDAHVRVGPYRASTDSNGLATFEVAAGEHRVTVGKPGYDAETTTVDICGDARLQVEATRVPEENPDAYWQG